MSSSGPLRVGLNSRPTARSPTCRTRAWVLMVISGLTGIVMWMTSSTLISSSSNSRVEKIRAPPVLRLTSVPVSRSYLRELKVTCTRPTFSTRNARRKSSFSSMAGTVSRSDLRPRARPMPSRLVAARKIRCPYGKRMVRLGDFRP